MSPRRMTWGVTLAGVGVILMLTNLQLIQWSVWLTLLSLWPVLLVTWGIGLVFRGSRLALLAPLLIVAAMAYAVVFPGQGRLPWGSGGAWDVVSEAVVARGDHSMGEASFGRKADGGVRSLRLDVDFGAGNLEVMGGASSSQQIYDATLEYRGVAPRETFAIQGAQAVAQLKGTGGVWGGPSRDWSIRLTEGHRVYLDIELAACSANMNLARVDVGSLRLHCGASEVHVALGKPKGRVPVTLECGAADVELNIPRGAQVRIHKNTMVGSVDTNGAGLIQQGAYLVSSEYDNAPNSYDVDVSNAVGEFRLRRDA